MKLIPLLFQTAMVQAVLAGNKSMTRRLRGLDKINEAPDEWALCGVANGIWSFYHTEYPEDGCWDIKCPYGYAGDILWVRETFFAGYVLDEWDKIPENAKKEYWYRADTRDARPGDLSDEYCMHLWGDDKSLWPSWKPSIHMPYDACRLWLKVTNIRVERAHDISEADCKAEGVLMKTTDNPYGYNYFNYITKSVLKGYTAKESFISLWVSINGKESWDKNPWLWVVEFKPCEKPDIQFAPVKTMEAAHRQLSLMEGID